MGFDPPKDGWFNGENHDGPEEVWQTHMGTGQATKNITKKWEYPKNGPFSAFLRCATGVPAR